MLAEREGVRFSPILNENRNVVGWEVGVEGGGQGCCSRPCDDRFSKYSYEPKEIFANESRAKKALAALLRKRASQLVTKETTNAKKV